MKMNTETYGIIGIILMLSSAVFMALFLINKWSDNNQDLYTAQFSGKEWTKLTGFENVKSAREYLNENSVSDDIIYSSDNIIHKVGEPMEKLKIPEENTGMRLDPNSGSIKVMTSEEYKQFQKEWGLDYSKSKLHVKGTVGIGGSNIFTKKSGNYYHFEGYKPNAFRPYKVEVKDEHQVVLTADNDTIVLYLENATVLAEERLIYIFPIKD